MIISIYIAQLPDYFPGGTVVRKQPARARDAGDTRSIPKSGRSPGEGNDNPLQHSCLEKSMNRGAWQATVHGRHKESDTVINFPFSHIDFLN